MRSKAQDCDVLGDGVPLESITLFKLLQVALASDGHDNACQ